MTNYDDEFAIAMAAASRRVHREDGTGDVVDRHLADDAAAHFLNREVEGGAHWKAVANASLRQVFIHRDPHDIHDALLLHRAVLDDWLNDLNTRNYPEEIN